MLTLSLSGYCPMINMEMINPHQRIVVDVVVIIAVSATGVAVECKYI